MAQLILNNVEEELVEELKLRAARNGKSPEEELRQIVERALGAKPGVPPLEDLLAQMPNVGEDEDFERRRDMPRSIDF